MDFDFLLFEGFEFVDLAFLRDFIDYFPLFRFLLLVLLGFIDCYFDNFGLIAIYIVFDFFKGILPLFYSIDTKRWFADVLRPPID